MSPTSNITTAVLLTSKQHFFIGWKRHLVVTVEGNRIVGYCDSIYIRGKRVFTSTHKLELTAEVGVRLADDWVSHPLNQGYKYGTGDFITTHDNDQSGYIRPSKKQKTDGLNLHVLRGVWRTSWDKRIVYIDIRQLQHIFPTHILTRTDKSPCHVVLSSTNPECELDHPVTLTIADMEYKGRNGSLPIYLHYDKH